MANTEERFDVVITSIYLNETEPADWDKGWEWKPSVSIQYERINNKYKTVSENLRARSTGMDKLWIFQAMDGKKAKGRFFDLMTESGETNGNPWTSFTPLAELFKDGSNRRIMKPDGSEVEPKPLQQKLGTKPADPPAPGPRAPSSNGNGAHKTTANGEKLPAIAATYLDQALFHPQSDAWWAVKDAKNMDGAVISNSFQYAAMMMGSVSVFDDGLKSLVLQWAAWYEFAIREAKHERLRSRFTMMLGISTTEKQVEELMNQAWASLPGSQYKILKDVALARLQDVKKGNSAPQAMTPVPEVEEQEVSDGSQAKGSEEDIPF